MRTKPKSRRQQNKKIVAKMFRLQKAIERAVDAEKQNTRLSSRVDEDPTADKAIKNVYPLKAVTLADGTKIYRPETWLWIIKHTYANIDIENDETVAKLKKAVVDKHCAGVYYQKVCLDMNISPHYYYSIVNSAMEFAQSAGCQMGLLRVI